MLDALRANEITYEVAKVLTLAPTDARCLEVLEGVRGRDARPDIIRRELTPDTVLLSDRRVAFVTLESYVAAGGTYQRDLFADSAYLHDEKLLNRLFNEKGAVEAERIRAEEGWKWALWISEGYVSYTVTEKLERLRRQPGILSEDDTAEYDDLAERAESQELDDIELGRREALQGRLDGDFTDEDRETGGVIVCFGRDGLQIDRAWRRREDRPAQQDQDSDGITTTIKPSAEESRAFPQNLRDDLDAIRLRALQTRLMDQHELMLDLLAWSLTGGLKPWSKPLGIRLELPNITPAKTEGTAVGGRLDAVDDSKGDRETSPVEFEAFRALGKKHRNQVLTEALARAFKDTGSLAEALAAQLDVNTRLIWSPTVAGFLGRTGGSYLDSLWQQLVPPSDVDPEHATFRSFKRADKAKKLQALFEDLSLREAMGLDRAHNARIDAWLPQELRWTKPTEGGAP